MPRRRRRFSDLERQFRESGGVAAPGSRLAGYIDFKKGINKIDVTKILTADERKRYGYGILPFGLSVPGTPDDGDRYAAPITVYSNLTRVDLGLSDNECGYNNIVAATKQDDDFYPALMRVFIKVGNKTTPTSGITKKEYSRQPGKSASIPFGRTITSVVDAETGTAETTVDDADQMDVRVTLALTARAGSGTTKANSLSFEPEVFRKGKSPLESPSAE